MLYNFSKWPFWSGVAPLLIFMGGGDDGFWSHCWRILRPCCWGCGTVRYFWYRHWCCVVVQFRLVPFTIDEAAAIGIIGGADGPTSIYVATMFAPHLLGEQLLWRPTPMALVPFDSTSNHESVDHHGGAQDQDVPIAPGVQAGEDSVPPVVVLILVALLLPDAAPLLGMFCLGNLMRGVRCGGSFERYCSKCLINIVTIIWPFGGR